MKKLLLCTACLASLTALARAEGPYGQPGPETGAPPAPTEVRRSTWPAEVAPSAVPSREALSRWRTACRDDVRRLCRNSYSQEEIIACLDRNSDQLSSGCRDRQGQINTRGENPPRP